MGKRQALAQLSLSTPHVFAFCKSLSWRIFGSALTFLMAFFIFGDVSLSSSFAVADFFIKLFSFYLHEIIWNKLTT